MRQVEQRGGVTPAGPEPEGLRGSSAGPSRRLLPPSPGAWVRDGPPGRRCPARGAGRSRCKGRGRRLGTAVRYGAAGPGRGGLRPHSSASCLSLGRRVASPTPSRLERSRWITGCGCEVREIKWERKKKKVFLTGCRGAALRIR